MSSTCIDVGKMLLNSITGVGYFTYVFHLCPTQVSLSSLMSHTGIAIVPYVPHRYRYRPLCDGMVEEVKVQAGR